jgi:hypothetical protein
MPTRTGRFLPAIPAIAQRQKLAGQGSGTHHRQIIQITDIGQVAGRITGETEKMLIAESQFARS